MPQNATEFKWTTQRAKAAQLVAEDEISDEKIAAELGIDRKTLWRWKEHPDFAARVDEIVSAIRSAVLHRGIGSKVKRVRAYDDRWRRMQRVIEARAEEYEHVAGGDTGLLVRQLKVIGVGKAARQVEEYAVDAGLLREMRETEKQAAQEVGDWSDRLELEDGSLTDEQRAERVVALLDRARARRDRQANRADGEK